MTTEKISITRALAELKLLDARINKKTGAINFVDTYQNRRDITVTSGMKKEDFTASVKADYDSLMGLIKRRNTIKTAILISNSTTAVKIGGNSMMVVEAIERKKSIVYESNMLTKMRQQLTKAEHNRQTNQVELEERVDEMLKQTLGTDKEPNKDTYENIGKPVFEANEIHILDPVDVKTKIETLDNDIDTFLSEVDFSLSESNSSTFIDV